ncbi:metal ABC transporter solute-binding protein, Zn/Mn family [Gordonia sp. FQ]|uniref:metal ABC transporter solute-binding protein, Zn/Mn family n=1 Tax=Gordonia sp. FQ TaxID=3446634 RepID=UPI003F85137A
MKATLTRRVALRRLAATTLIAATGFAAVACGSDSEVPKETDNPTVVASTDVWGSVASAVVGDHGTVTSLFHSPGSDPHEFEPSMADTAKIEDADVLVFNGLDYDAYMETAAKNSKAYKVNAVSLLPGGAGDATQDDHDHGDEGHHHDHGGVNEHVFYDLTVVGKVADQTAEKLGKVSPKNAQYYKDNAAKFNTGITGLRDRLAAIKARHDGAKVAATEPLAGYLLTEAGLVDVAPASFTAAVEDGQSPSAADVAKFNDLLTGRQVRALIYNTQAVDPATEALLKVARTSNVPVVQVTESLPAGVTDYLAWQSAQIQQLEQALNA